MHILQTATQAALKAGNLEQALFGKPHQIRHKGPIDIVTEADIAAEEAILTILDADSTGVAVLAEESRSHYNGMPSGPTWIIDPLDGTTNFAHGFPWFGVSIAYLEDGVAKAGVIYCPMQDELFCAVQGHGAWLNGKRTAVSVTKILNEALVATGFPYNIKEKHPAVMAALASIITRVQDVRRAGAAALDLAYVACGRLDGFWEIKLKPWDTAAGQLLVAEAGGRTTDFAGGEYSPFLPEILASNGCIHDKLTQLLQPYSEMAVTTAP
jgi:myo-inositol-1(or 4)-monophosphatase